MEHITLIDLGRAIIWGLLFALPLVFQAVAWMKEEPKSPTQKDQGGGWFFASLIAQVVYGLVAYWSK